METISQVLFWVANSLLIPDIILLLLLFIRSLLLIGGVYNQYMTKRKNDKQMNRLIKELTPDTIGELKGALPGRDNSLYIRYLRDLLTTPPSPDYSDYLITNFENDGTGIGIDRHLDCYEPCLGRTFYRRYRRYGL